MSKVSVAMEKTKKLKQNTEVKTDTLLGRIASSEWSWAIILGYSVGLLVIGVWLGISVK